MFQDLRYGMRMLLKCSCVVGHATGFAAGGGRSSAAVTSSTRMLVSVNGLAACWLPAHRAAQVDPLEALRSE